MVPTQINRLTRDVNELDIWIRRATKRGNIQKAEDLKAKKEIYMEDMMQLREITRH